MTANSADGGLSGLARILDLWPVSRQLALAPLAGTVAEELTWLRMPAILVQAQ